MKLFTCVLMVTSLFGQFCYAGYIPPASQRVDLNLNDGWKFNRGDVDGAQDAKFDDAAWGSISIPHTWNNLDGQDGGGDYYRGVGWYRRHYNVDGSNRNREFFLKFDGANTVADVYVNGTFVGEHQGGFSAFAFDVTPHIKVGADNVIAVKVNNAYNADIPPLQADFTFFGGLYRNVHLLVTDKLHISPLDYASPGVYLKQTDVSDKSADLQITTKVRNDDDASKHAVVKSVIVDATGKIVASLTATQTVAATTTADFVQKATISAPHLWNGRADPYLYRVYVQVSDDKGVHDLVEQPLGFRYYNVDPNSGFHLNGKYLDLHGVCFHQDRLNKGWAISDADQEEDVGMIMEVGSTVVRLSHYQHPQKTYDLCDQNGLVAWSEIPLIDNITDSVNFSNNARQQLVETIRQNYNHPSVCFWGIYNEILLKKGPDPRPLVQALNQLAKAEDTTRPTTSASCCVDDNDPINWYVDVPSFNRYFGWYWGDYDMFGPYIDRTHAITNLPCGISEYGAGASLIQHMDDPPKPVNPNNAGVPHYEEYQNLLHEATWQQMQARPYLWLKAIWNMFDFASDGRVESTSPGRNDKGLVTYDRQTRKDAFYWYKANWTTNAFVYITSRRFSPRGPVGAKVPVKVYANCNSVQLLFNGTSQGTLSSTNHIYEWSGLTLANGSNTVVAIGTMDSRACTDSVVWITGGAVNVAAQPLSQLHASGAAIVDDRDHPVTLRGCNLGNWLLNEMWMMDMAHKGEPGDQWQMEELLIQRFGATEKDRLMDVFRENWIQPRDFEILKTWGFNVVRLPFNSTLLEDDATPGQLRTNAFQWLDRAIDMATQAGIYVIVDMHGAPGRQSTDQCTGRSGQNKLWEPENRKRAAFLWRKIADRYKNSPTVAGYDLLNEPYGDYHTEPPDATIVSTMDELIHTIREVDQKHLIFCAGNLRGVTMMYGPPASRGWTNVGYTEHFYPGLFGGVPSLETHARFLSRDLQAKAELFQQWKVPFLAGEFNVVLDRAGGSDMMRRYYDVFATNGWAGTMWSYKLVKHEGGCHPDNWYLVTNRGELTVPSLRTAAKDEIESFFKAMGTMDYAQDDELRVALTSATPPALVLHDYPPPPSSAPQDHPPSGWQSSDLGNPFRKGGQRVLAKNSLEILGGGRDIFEGADEFHFVSRTSSDHFDLRADVTTPFDSDTYAKAGLMYRASLDADAPIVMVSLFPDGTCTFSFRRERGARITEVRMPPPGKTQALRLVRTGSHFEATAIDADGQAFATQSVDVPELAATGDLGMFVCSHQALLLSKATFANIEFH